MGLELTTLRSRGACSIDWASRAPLSSLLQILQRTHMQFMGKTICFGEIYTLWDLEVTGRVYCAILLSTSYTLIIVIVRLFFAFWLDSTWDMYIQEEGRMGLECQATIASHTIKSRLRGLHAIDNEKICQSVHCLLLPLDLLWSS